MCATTGPWRTPSAGGGLLLFPATALASNPSFVTRTLAGHAIIAAAPPHERRDRHRRRRPIDRPGNPKPRAHCKLDLDHSGRRPCADGLTPRERAEVKWTLMKQSAKQFIREHLPDLRELERRFFLKRAADETGSEARFPSDCVAGDPRAYR